ncbi:MAG: pilus assembly protein [Rhodospirillales bacterium]|nr:pilus assembly protein [Rhodospirillales bacterium]
MMGKRGIAALEFALVVPVFLIMLAGGADLGFMAWDRGLLANAVAQGGYFAALTGTSVTQSQITSVVTNATGLAGVTASITGPTLYCASGTPPTLSAAPSSGDCTDGTKPGSYVTITAQAPAFSIGQAMAGFGATTLTETATVRLQ